MSTNKDLFKEAIADAKAVREAALANAKVALEEALAPKLQSMLSAKLQEMEDPEDDDDDDYSDLGDIESDDAAKAQAFADMEDDDLEEDFDLSEILADLDFGDDMNEAKKDDKKDNKKASKKDDESEEDEKITDLTVDELKDMIKDIVSSELEAEEYETPGEEEAEMSDDMSLDVDGMGGEEETEDEEFNLDELLAELDSLNENEDKDGMNEGASDFIKKISSLSAEKLAKLKKFYNDEISPASVKPGGKYYGKATKLPSNISEDEDMEEGMGDTIKKIGTAVKKGVGNVKKAWQDEYSPAAMKKAVAAGKGYSKLPSNLEEEENEMYEAVKTIKALRNELNETNLLNAKLLYVNRIFKDKNLTESQKLRVIAQFDKATTTKEAKNLYESMNSALAVAKKSTIKESLGFASKAAGIAPQKQIVQVDDTVARWKMLAGITKF